MFFVFGILAAPVLSRLLAPSWDGYDADQDRPLPNAILDRGISLLIVVWDSQAAKTWRRRSSDGSPVKAVDFMETHHLSGPMLNDYVYGGYLIWAAPDHPVFLDGRADVFEWTGVLSEFGKWATLQSNPNTPSG